MEKINRSLLIKAHTLLAAFILPVAIMFFVTGALYTWGIKGGTEKTTQELHIKAPIQGELTELVALAKNELQKQGVGLPSGNAKIKKIGSSFQLEWSGSTVNVVLAPTFQPLVVTLTIENASWYRQLVQLHKAKGGIPFKVYATAFAIALLLLIISGFLMALQMPKLRQLTLISALLSIALFVVMVISS
ncbi:PepSY domain-containing protein [Psychromonas sp. SR45-3]|uniref:PepSY domain-containing protein n=1 Tax=Psychromonas sp. SR45-3 TaxID=2760930 RepID=UPI0015FB7D1B|nr:PepSY domain-containing protein [Psychromonas sp. SR45-3]MBB1273532.1 PepSY domain-containing protein [Psychromonas sp. SR45-3]